MIMFFNRHVPLPKGGTLSCTCKALRAQICAADLMLSLVPVPIIACACALLLKNTNKNIFLCITIRTRIGFLAVDLSTVVKKEWIWVYPGSHQGISDTLFRPIL